jgi:hypothetical protein
VQFVPSAAERAGVGAEGGLGDDGEGRLADGDLDGFEELVEVAERLQLDEVDTGVGQDGDLFRQRVDAGGAVDPPPLLHAHRGGDRPGDEDEATAARRGVPGDPHRAAVDLLDPLGEAVLAEPQPGGAEGVGLDDVHPGVDVAVVHGAHEGGIGQ